MVKGIIDQLAEKVRFHPALRRLGNRYGRSYWRLPGTLRRRLVWEAAVPGLFGARTLGLGAAESVASLPMDLAGGQPTAGHRLAAQGFRSESAFVSKLGDAWLVGKYASPVTLDGRLILSAFRDEPRMLGLESHSDLERWLESPAPPERPEPALEYVWPMVNRLQTNYFHWLVEWCSRLEFIERYESETNIPIKVLIPQKAPKYVRESLSLLGVGEDKWVEWPDDSAPRAVRNLILPSFRGSTVSSSPAALQWLRQRMLSGAMATAIEATRKIYISRPQGGWRSILNDDEVCRALANDGFEILQPQNLSLAEQVRMFATAKLIVGLHGSGLTNVLFAPQAAVLELFGSYGDGTWFAMTRRLGQRYEMIRCEPKDQDVRVDVAMLRSKIAAFSRH